MTKWAIELSEYGIQYKPRLSLKGKVLVDFITELPRKQVQIDTTNHWWILHVDKALRTSKVGVGLVLFSLTKEQIEKSIHIDFPVSNNEVKYEVMIVGLELALILAASKVEIRSDFQLVVRQI